MKRFWLACMMGCSLNGLAQSNTPEVTNSGNSRNATPVVLDSVQVIQERRVAKPAAAESKSAKKKTQVELNREDELRVAPPASEKDSDGAAPKANKAEAAEGATMEQATPMANDAEKTLAVPAATMQMQQQQFELNQMNSTHQYSRRSASPEEQLQMDQSVQYYKVYAPGSFESHFYAYLAGHYNWALYPELEAAAKMQPYNTEVIKQQAAYFIMTGKQELAIESIEKLISAKQLAQDQLRYASDVLISGMENGVIVFHGFEDMLAAYYMQQKGLRNDVRLLSLDFQQSADYKSVWKEDENMAFPAGQQIDTAYLREFCRLNPTLNVQIAMTVPKDYFDPLKGNLYPVGLTFLYSEVPVDYYERNKLLWYEQLTKEYFEIALILKAPKREVNEELAKSEYWDEYGPGENIRHSAWATNYLPMMITLRDQLEKAGEKEKAAELAKQIELLKQ